MHRDLFWITIRPYAADRSQKLSLRCARALRNGAPYPRRPCGSPAFCRPDKLPLASTGTGVMAIRAGPIAADIRTRSMAASRRPAGSPAPEDDIDTPLEMGRQQYGRLTATWRQAAKQCRPRALSKKPASIWIVEGGVDCGNVTDYLGAQVFGHPVDGSVIHL